jgi:hypothetical protein
LPEGNLVRFFSKKGSAFKTKTMQFISPILSKTDSSETETMKALLLLYDKLNKLCDKLNKLEYEINRLEYKFKQAGI